MVSSLFAMGEYQRASTQPERAQPELQFTGKHYNYNHNPWKLGSLHLQTNPHAAFGYVSKLFSVTGIQFSLTYIGV